MAKQAARAKRASLKWMVSRLSYDSWADVGGVAIESYQFANQENTVLQFSCYDPSGIQDNAAMFLRYGDDESTRTEFPNFRWNAVQ